MGEALKPVQRQQTLGTQDNKCLYQIYNHDIEHFGLNSAQAQLFSEKIILMLADSESESASSKLDDPTMDESGRKAQTWSFRVCVRLKDGQTFSNLLDARKQQLETSLASALVILWAFANTASLESQNLNGMHLEGFVHASTHIRLGSLNL